MYVECINVFSSKACPHHWITCWLLTNTAVTSAVANFRCHRLIAKVNKWKNSVIKTLFAINMWKTCYFKHQKCQSLWMNNKVRGNKNEIRLHFLAHLLNICRQFEFLISQDMHSSVPKVRWIMLNGFVAYFVCFPTVQKFWKSVDIWQSYRDFKNGNFFWDTVHIKAFYV